MANWTFDPSQYQEKSFVLIPVGDYRARIEQVEERTFSSGNQGYTITMAINGYSSRLWFYLVLDPSDPAKTNQRIGEFFDSFGITTPNLGNGSQWVGHIGAVRIKHEQYEGSDRAKIAYCIAKARQDKLAPWSQEYQPTSAAAASTVSIPDNLPFEV